ncbi:M4 family metallopeptidase [Lysobacter silvisoli]|uniref:Neutral metalloproteinase n=1 Tax=Lysobacter silvisoli TaxID=2293254 RepID=A0A371K7E3_9GAMM|nr:M4 family peptidase [Lysobacter silvisoli]
MFASTSPEEADASPAADRARGLLAGAAARQVHRVPGDGFVARDVLVDRDGTEHVRMDRRYQDLPVIGGDMVVHSRNGRVLSITQAEGMRSDARPQLKPGIDADRALLEAGSLFDGRIDDIAAQLVIYARGAAPTLAYQVSLTGQRSDQSPGNLSYYLDARNGKLLQEDDHFHTAAATGTGRSLTLGNVSIVTNSVSGGYQMTDPSRGNGQTLDARNRSSTSGATVFSDSDNTWGNNTVGDRASAAADAHYGVAATFDYFKNTHGRNGIGNNGNGVRSYVHWGSNYVNAGWNGSYMVYGDGDGVTYKPLVALDVAGHEMAHGVTGATARLGYYNVKDAGGLNESTSDIFGTLVEYGVANSNDPGDFLIGEEIYISNPGDTKALRLMFKQDADGKSFACYPAGGFSASLAYARGPHDPHQTSGVGNRFFYLLAQGAVAAPGFSYTPAQLVCNGDTGIVGIGRTKAGAIWYRALTRYFVSSTTYPQARTGTLQAAADLYGNGSAEYQAVARAWSAVQVN